MGGIDGLRIAPAVPGDLDTLGRVFGSGARAYYLERTRQRGVLLVARVGQRALGAVFVSLAPAKEDGLIRHLGRVPMLHKLMVDEPVRRRLVGTRLITAAEHLLRSRGYPRVAVGVDVDNSRAARLYLRLGYREWAYGLLETIREDIDEHGKVIVRPDECHVFVKQL